MLIIMIAPVEGKNPDIRTLDARVKAWNTLPGRVKTSDAARQASFTKDNGLYTIEFPGSDHVDEATRAAVRKLITLHGFEIKVVRQIPDPSFS